jgi:hypothetical protein
VFGALFASRCARAAHNDFDAMSSNAGSLLRGETVDGAKWLAQWVWQLSRTAVRSMVAGLQASSGGGVRALGSSERIVTASVRFRDELTRLLLHAGFATRGVARVATRWFERDVWAVWYGGRCACATPTVRTMLRAGRRRARRVSQ